MPPPAKKKATIADRPIISYKKETVAVPPTATVGIKKPPQGLSFLDYEKRISTTDKVPPSQRAPVTIQNEKPRLVVQKPSVPPKPPMSIIAERPKAPERSKIYNLPPIQIPNVVFQFRLLMKKVADGKEKIRLLVAQPIYKNQKMISGVYGGYLQAARGERPLNSPHVPMEWSSLDVRQTVTVPTVKISRVSQEPEDVQIINPTLMTQDPTNPHFSHLVIDRIGTERNINEIFALWSCEGYTKVASSDPWITVFREDRSYNFGDQIWDQYLSTEKYSCL